MSNTKGTQFEPDFSLYQTNSFYEELDLLNDERNQEKFIKDIERIIRTSLEYRAYIKYLKTEALLKKCTILDRLPEEILNSITIEMHHFPFTLYELVKTVLVSKLKNNEIFTRLSIANEVMDLHYLNQVGIVPLSTTMHQLAHNDTRVISKKSVFGNYHHFIEKYNIYISEEQKNKLVKLDKLSDTLVYNTVNNYLEIDESLFRDFDDSDMDKVHLVEVKDKEKEDEEMDINEFLKLSANSPTSKKEEK